MDTKQYHLDAEMTLKPVWHADPPKIIVGIDQEVIYAGELHTPTTFKFDYLLPLGDYDIWVEFINKKDADTQGNLDKAVIVEQIKFNDITDPRFVWAGMYEPIYPEPWASQQTHLEPVLSPHTYLGWNGKWVLTFDIPIFTWIHRVENLGWIYD